MNVTHVAIRPSQAAVHAGRPALTPELLAASGARYSRNNEGLEAILARIDPANLEPSVDAIFRMVDYGHQSIADMVPAALFIDGISIWLAYYLWTLCPTASGQESSTRYLRISGEDLLPPEVLGIPEARVPSWRQTMDRCYQAYQDSLALWEDLAARDPAIMGIPLTLLRDDSEPARKKVARMKRNYAFDRARYFLPAAAATNVMLLMSARGWVHLCQHLLSHPLPEPRALGERVRAELELCAPRMVKYARPTECVQAALAREFDRWVQLAKGEPEWDPAPKPEAAAIPFLSVALPPDVSPASFSDDLAHHVNRYAPIGTGLQRTSVRFGWSAIGFAEIRDLNRHRTGTKYCPQVPKGFYFARDQAPAGGADGGAAIQTRLDGLADAGRSASRGALDLLRDGVPAHVYWSVLGTEFPFEHLTTADKFIYEAELRTGVGAHFRYARHLREVLALWYQQFPATRPRILEGSAEPE